VFHKTKCAQPGLILSFRADGPFWTDLVHLLAYPEGISYIWPFRYDRERIAANVCAEIEDAKSRRALSGQSVLITARFQTENAKQKLLPIRQATLIGVDVWAGVYSFTFRLGQSFQFQQASDLDSCTTQTQQPFDLLAFREEIKPTLEITKAADLAGTAWKAFVRLVANETKLPINKEATRSLFIYVGVPAVGCKSASVDRIQKSPSGSDVYGYKLKEGQNYEVKYSHFIPSLEGKNTTVREIIVRPQFSDATIQFTETEATLIGNYGTQSLMMGAVSPTAVWHGVAIAPAEKKLISQTSNIEINTHRFQIPVSVRWSLFSWLRRKLLPTAVLFAALVALGIANTIDKNLPKLLDGSLKWSQAWDNRWLIAIVILCAAAASLAIPILQSQKKPK
jgi:hypothetical protein